MRVEMVLDMKIIICEKAEKKTSVGGHMGMGLAR